ncbi:ferredoxin family protein [Nocardia sp. NPDC050713]|uniref:4Fe-4S dicluster domain-containing protein n=1 Tax=Nocardia sp. NPDC050713 TaxID=3154511 RepID=UPI0033CC4C66
MAYVIAAPCVADYSCLEVCPADCIRPGPDDPEFETAEQLHIDPANCIECDSCVSACPVGAVYDAPELPPQWSHYESVNADWFRTDA